MNRIQFQKGLSLPEFQSLYGTEKQCEAALEKTRWPDGYHCSRCQSTLHCVLHVRSRKTFQCGVCNQQTSLIAGTLFHSTKLPLTTWFLAIYLVSQSKNNLSALSLNASWEFRIARPGGSSTSSWKPWHAGKTGIR